MSSSEGWQVSRAGGLAVLVTSHCLLASCATTRIPFSGAAEGERVVPARLLATERLPAPAARQELHSGPLDLTPATPGLRHSGTRQRYDVFEVRLPSLVDGQELVTARYFRARDTLPHPVAVILPIWGRSRYPAWVTTRRLLAEGRYNVLRVHGRRRLVDWDGLEDAATPADFAAATERSAKAMAMTVMDLRRLIAWLAERQETAPGEIAVVGYSFSAIVGALVLGQEPLVSRGVLVMGGGHLEQVFGHCDRRAGRVRERAIERFGWSEREFETRVARYLAPLDPVSSAHRADPAGILYVDASRDNCIPATARVDLWLAFGRPERIQIHSTHRSAFLTMTVLRGYWLTRQIVDFLHRLPRRPAGVQPVLAGEAAGLSREPRPE